MALAALLTPTTAQLLRDEGLGDCVPFLLSAGLTRIEDIANNRVKEGDLQAIGIDKLFHQRKLVRLSHERIEQQQQRAAAQQQQQQRYQTPTTPQGGSRHPPPLAPLGGGGGGLGLGMGGANPTPPSSSRHRTPQGGGGVGGAAVGLPPHSDRRMYNRSPAQQSHAQQSTPYGHGGGGGWTADSSRYTTPTAVRGGGGGGGGAPPHHTNINTNTNNNAVVHHSELPSYPLSPSFDHGASQSVGIYGGGSGLPRTVSFTASTPQHQHLPNRTNSFTSSANGGGGVNNNSFFFNNSNSTIQQHYHNSSGVSNAHNMQQSGSGGAAVAGMVGPTLSGGFNQSRSSMATPLMMGTSHGFGMGSSMVGGAPPPPPPPPPPLNYSLASHNVPATPSVRERLLRRQREQQSGERRAMEGGDHILIHVIAAKSAPNAAYPLAANKTYRVRIGLSDFFRGAVVGGKKGSSVTTPGAKGPNPLFLFDGDGGGVAGMLSTGTAGGIVGGSGSGGAQVSSSSSVATPLDHAIGSAVPPSSQQASPVSVGSGGGVFTRAVSPPTNASKYSKGAAAGHSSSSSSAKGTNSSGKPSDGGHGQQQPLVDAVATYGDAHDPTCIKLRTNFMQHCVTFELLEARPLLLGLGADKVVGCTVFPIAFFHRFTADTIIDSWFPVRLPVDPSATSSSAKAGSSAGGGGGSGNATEGVLETALGGIAEGSQMPFAGSNATTTANNVSGSSSSPSSPSSSSVIAAIRLVLEVPGGCPRQVGKAYHISTINMTNRVFRLEVFDAVVFQNTLTANKFVQRVTDLISLPTTPVRGLDDIMGSGAVSPDRRQHQQKVNITLATAPHRDLYISIRVNDKDASSRRWTRTVAGPTYHPTFNDEFSWGGEVADSKCVTLLLKRKKGLFSKPAVIGAAHIPLQFFLSQSHSNLEEKMAVLVDVHNPLLIRACVHVRLCVCPIAKAAEASTRPPLQLSVDAIEKGTAIPIYQQQNHQQQRLSSGRSGRTSPLTATGASLGNTPNPSNGTLGSGQQQPSFVPPPSLHYHGSNAHVNNGMSPPTMPLRDFEFDIHPSVHGAIPIMGGGASADDGVRRNSSSSSSLLIGVGPPEGAGGVGGPSPLSSLPHPHQQHSRPPPSPPQSNNSRLTDMTAMAGPPSGMGGSNSHTGERPPTANARAFGRDYTTSAPAAASTIANDVTSRRASLSYGRAPLTPNRGPTSHTNNYGGGEAGRTVSSVTAASIGGVSALSPTDSLSPSPSAMQFVKGSPWVPPLDNAANVNANVNGQHTLGSVVGSSALSTRLTTSNSNHSYASAGAGGGVLHVPTMGRLAAAGANGGGSDDDDDSPLAGVGRGGRRRSQHSSHSTVAGVNGGPAVAVGGGSGMADRFDDDGDDDDDDGVDERFKPLETPDRVGGSNSVGGDGGAALQKTPTDIFVGGGDVYVPPPSTGIPIAGAAPLSLLAGLSSGATSANLSYAQYTASPTPRAAGGGGGGGDSAVALAQLVDAAASRLFGMGASSAMAGLGPYNNSSGDYDLGGGGIGYRLDTNPTSLNALSSAAAGRAAVGGASISLSPSPSDEFGGRGGGMAGAGAAVAKTGAADGGGSPESLDFSPAGSIRSVRGVGGGMSLLLGGGDSAVLGGAPPLTPTGAAHHRPPPFTVDAPPMRQPSLMGAAEDFSGGFDDSDVDASSSSGSSPSRQAPPPPPPPSSSGPPPAGSLFSSSASGTLLAGGVAQLVANGTLPQREAGVVPITSTLSPPPSAARRGGGGGRSGFNNPIIASLAQRATLRMSVGGGGSSGGSEGRPSPPSPPSNVAMTSPSSAMMPPSPEDDIFNDL